MKYYYAVFEKTKESIEVEFPDLDGCLTFGDDWEEAMENAIDVLAAFLANSEPQFIKEPSSHKELEKLKLCGQLIPIPVDEKIKEQYIFSNIRGKEMKEKVTPEEKTYYRIERSYLDGSHEFELMDMIGYLPISIVEETGRYYDHYIWYETLEEAVDTFEKDLKAYKDYILQKEKYLEQLKLNENYGGNK